MSENEDFLEKESEELKRSAYGRKRKVTEMWDRGDDNIRKMAEI